MKRGAHVAPTPARGQRTPGPLQLWRLQGDRLEAAPELRLDRPQLASLIGAGGFGELIAAGGALYWQVGGAVLRIDDHGVAASVAVAAAPAWRVWTFAVVGGALLLQTERSGTEWWWLSPGGGEATRVEGLPADGARLVGEHEGRLWFVMTRAQQQHLGPLPGETVTLHDLVAIPPEQLR